MEDATTRRWILAGLVLLSVLVVGASFQTGDVLLRILLILPTALLWVVYREAERRRRDAQVLASEGDSQGAGRR
ncbi:hypothetical protein C5E07_17470 [Pseudoclavibacter sp. RFBJ3]|uniref:hypothetical protein n=1 Tax=unclassified Pseudoclavibacter TaxID=2615177 RepID=UPI000CE72868|nr:MULTISPECIES: hypothetical protein [unclassified Pseudoclavibacter]PPF86082.1 hypothetical protein C5C12_02915 [Pseudoclavibacter sp. RFBJ5]PPF89784.1 hypothetical protein C5E07_17470 [Pseudoclavibacter sp. RFBJ3]PPF97354.1 hypothetical protein C5C19_12340 [Pseudoclavibacter sp. RFBH5]PPG19670.1 hypothetical protein C5E13_16355 [Pseudoclavibacter sp. RFBI4]